LGNWGWLEWMVTFPPVNGEHGVNRLGTSRLEVVGVGGLGGCSRFPDCRQVDLQGVFIGIWGGYTRQG